MKIVVAGGSGFIGRNLCKALIQENHHVTVLTRSGARAQATLGPLVTVAQWDAKTSGPWESAVDGADALINLAGEPIAAGRWTAERKRLLFDSRVLATRLLVHAVERARAKPAVLVNASGIGYYGARNAMPVAEKTQAGTGFLAELCTAWEKAASEAEQVGIRVVLLRIGMVLGRDGGALAQMVPPFKMFLGGPVLPGYQWVSWVHTQDLVGLVRWAISNERVRGPVNAVAPDAVTMREFCRTVGRVLHRPSWLPVPAFALRLGLGELSTMLTTGQRVEPAAAQSGGYTFKHPSLGFALHDVLDRPIPGQHHPPAA